MAVEKSRSQVPSSGWRARCFRMGDSMVAPDNCNLRWSDICYYRPVEVLMSNKLKSVLAGLAAVASAVWLAPLFSSPPPPVPQAKTAAQPSNAAAKEIVAALPEIPAARFRMADYGAVGDGKAMNTDAFKSAVAAVEKAGGGHLIVPAGIYKTLPFTLVSKMDLHLDPGATIKAPDSFEEYGMPDPNKMTGPVARGAFGMVAPLISCANCTDVAITGSGTIDGSGANFWIWSDKAARRYPPGRPVVPRPVLVRISNVKRLHVDGVTLTNSPMFHLVPTGEDITIENLRIV